MSKFWCISVSHPVLFAVSGEDDKRNCRSGANPQSVGQHRVDRALEWLEKVGIRVLLQLPQCYFDSAMKQTRTHLTRDLNPLRLKVCCSTDWAILALTQSYYQVIFSCFLTAQSGEQWAVRSRNDSAESSRKTGSSGEFNDRPSRYALHKQTLLSVL